MTQKFEPTLSAKLRKDKGPEILRKDMLTVTWPKLISIKYDGVRMWNPYGDAMLSRTLKPFKNRRIQARWGGPAYQGLDGEAICGLPYQPEGDEITVMQRSGSATSSFDGPEVDFYVFDYYDLDLPNPKRFEERYEYARAMWQGSKHIHFVEQKLIRSWEEAEQFMADRVDEGYEGAMLRDPRARYMIGRSTLRENVLIKLKPWADAEAEIVGFVESRENQNEAKIDERGYTKRSSHKANKVGKDILGALICRSPRWEDTFKIGTGIGFNDELKQKIWDNQPDYLGATVTFKFFEMRTYKKPSCPSFRAVRPKGT